MYSHDIKSLLIYICILFYSIPVTALPFGFEYSDSSEQHKKHQISKTVSPFFGCYFEYVSRFEIAHNIPFTTIENENLHSKINGELTRLNMTLEFEKLRSKEWVDLYSRYGNKAYYFTTEYNQSPSYRKSMQIQVNNELGLFKRTFEYDQQQYIIERLIKSKEFDRFFRFRENKLPVQAFIYQFPEGKVCAQYINDKLVQLNFTSEDIKDYFNEISNAINKKYKDVATVTTYELKDEFSIYQICGLPHYGVMLKDYKEDEDKKCYISKFEANLTDGSSIKMETVDKIFKAKLFNNPDLIEGQAITPFVTYFDKDRLILIKKNEDKITLDYVNNIINPIYLLLEKLINESKKLDKKTENSRFLEEF
ncbi:hypothetical protein [Endozoicomonas ascidiicola]|uniref:hypothetical protein n=1 Tax=Endozoicomonas ascidiicola TaxID=1698521 RepID=UPI0008295F99|nr:hypothetical protein [Endozoicomonas ascidiicola]